MKRAVLYTYAILVGLICSCHSPDHFHIRALLRSDSIEKLPPFIATKYKNEYPLSEIINLPDYVDSTVSLKLSSDTDVEVYAVGELVYNLADAERPYYLLGDDMELSLKSIIGRTNIHQVLSWSDGVVDAAHKLHISRNGLQLCGKKADPKTADARYMAEISIPLRMLCPTISARNSIIFNLAIGDADDHYKQESKIAWSMNAQLYQSDTAHAPNFMLIQKGQTRVSNNSVIQCMNSTAKIDGDFEEWVKLKPYPLRGVVSGGKNIRDKFDLSAQLKCCWNRDSLYIYVDILDSKQYSSRADSDKKRNTFSDYGFIQNLKGESIWKMHVFDSKHAGGAMKNQKIDTVLHLKKGVYKVSYSSDESHSFNNWDDSPPATPFYGIVIYKYKK